MSAKMKNKNNLKNKKKIQVFTKKKKSNQPESVLIQKLQEKYSDVSMGFSYIIWVFI